MLRRIEQRHAQSVQELQWQLSQARGAASYWRSQRVRVQHVVLNAEAQLVSVQADLVGGGEGGGDGGRGPDRAGGGGDGTGDAGSHCNGDAGDRQVGDGVRSVSAAEEIRPEGEFASVLCLFLCFVVELCPYLCSVRTMVFF